MALKLRQSLFAWKGGPCYGSIIYVYVICSSVVSFKPEGQGGKFYYEIY